MSSRRISNEISNMNCGFELSTERYLVSTLIANGIQQFCSVKELFVPVMRASKSLNIHYSAVAIYGGGPFHTYGDMIQQVSTLDFVIRYKLGRVVSGVYGHEFKMKVLSAECIEQILSQDDDIYQSGIFGDRSDGRKSGISLKAKNIVDHVFEDHILGK